MACAAGAGIFAGSEKDKDAGRSGDWETAIVERRRKIAMDQWNSARRIVIAHSFCQTRFQFSIFAIIYIEEKLIDKDIL
jgi:hypothetical protein